MDIRKYQISQYELIHVLSKVARNYKLLNLYIFDHIIIGIYSCKLYHIFFLKTQCIVSALIVE